MTARSALNRMLDDLDLEFTYRDEAVVITTSEDAETQLLSRIYFLEGTGLPRGDSVLATNLIQQSIEPDTWEFLGGVGTIYGIGDGTQGRPAILTSTRLPVHSEIAKLLRALRTSHIGPDPIHHPDTSSKRTPKGPTPPKSGGMF